VRVPVKRDGVVKYVLTAVMKPDPIQEILASQRLTDNTVSSVVDRAATIVARTRGQAEYFGKPASQGLVDLLAPSRESGWAITDTLEGDAVYTVYYRSPRTGYAAAIGIPIGVLDGPVRRSYLLLGALVLASVLLGLIASQLVTRAITRPMRELKVAADAVGDGRAPRLPDTDLPEISGVAAALAKAHGQIESSLESERAARAREHEARVLAEQASRMKDEFIAMLGHELRNPLAAVSSASSVLEHSLRDAPVGPVVANATAIIRRQTHHLARLTDDLLDAGRVVIGRIRLDRKSVDLAAIVHQALESLRNAHRLDGYTIDVALAPLWIDADPVRMNQIVMNLLTNAVKYTPAPGAIDVRLERDGDDAVLAVRDTGIGIEPDLLPRIFDLFVQGKRSLDRSQGGLGIGLTLVRRLVELHGGQVGAASGGLGSGAQFTVRLPALRAQSAQASVEQAPPVAACRIVIVEDNDDVRTSLKQLLTMDGHDVREAADGPSGLELIVTTRPDVALVDIGLPGLDGLALARAVRGTPGGEDITLLAMTGYGSTENVRSGLQAGYDDYLVKPVDPSILRELLAAAPAAARSTSKRA
jgi:signal transduction histidine kinase/ActR/RegA family two-component response regulator